MPAPDLRDKLNTKRSSNHKDTLETRGIHQEILTKCLLKEQVCKLLQKDSSIAIDQMPIVLQSPFNMEILEAFCLIDLKILEDLQYKVPSTPLNMLSYTGIKCLSNESGSRLFAKCLHILSRVQPSLASISQIKKHN